MKEFDTIIIGGGLSGSSTALNLSKKGYSVLIIEKGISVINFEIDCREANFTTLGGMKEIEKYPDPMKNPRNDNEYTNIPMDKEVIDRLRKI